jgi:phenylpropionate dioxygenase-like ring-hydroxylating dioxygenase large terminal subunit
MFPMNQWYVAALGWEVTEQPLARTYLNHPVALFRLADGSVAALEDRCCHRGLPLSFGRVDGAGLRCGYHGLLFDTTGRCIEIPGQSTIPPRACVRRYHVREQDQIVWIWMPAEIDAPPAFDPPSYPLHSDPAYRFKGGAFHFKAAYQLIHDNLMDLSHLGYVHGQTIGGDPKTHMQAEMLVAQEGDTVRVTRWMKASRPPRTYTDAWPFVGQVDRWQEIESAPTHFRIWTGAADAGTQSLEDPGRHGFHLRGFHGVTPETDTTTHYIWTIASNQHSPDLANIDAIYEQSVFTFNEDKVVIEAQYDNLARFPEHRAVDIHVDLAANRVRRIVDRLAAESAKTGMP